MFKRALWIAFSVSLLAFVAASAARADDVDRKSILTFSQPSVVEQTALQARADVERENAAPPPVAPGPHVLVAPLVRRVDNRRPEQPATIRRDVARPSSDFTTYIEGELVQVSIPSNWRELPGLNAVTFAPEGAYGNAGVKSVFTHGLGMGVARNDAGSLRTITDDFIAAHLFVNPDHRRRFRRRNATIGDRPGLHTILSTVSATTGEPERIEMFTTLLTDNTLFYVLAVAPRDRYPEYRATFQRVIDSIQFTTEAVKR